MRGQYPNGYVHRLRQERAQARDLLRLIVTDVEAMQCKDGTFGAFRVYSVGLDSCHINWPYLAIMAERAKEVLNGKA